jgi:hypothetical protein
MSGRIEGFAEMREALTRATALGIAVNISLEADRAVDPLPRDWPHSDILALTTTERGELLRCPTCNDGIRTIEYPARCRECTKEGL